MPKKPNLNDLISRKVNRLHDIPEQFISDAARVNKAVFDVILSNLNKLQSEGENIAISKKNLVNADKTINEVKDVLLKGEYFDLVTRFAKEINNQAVINDDYFAAAFEYKPSATVKAILERTQRNAIELLVDAPLTNNFLLPVRAEMEKSIVSGASLKDTIKNMRSLIEGTAQKDGKLIQYAKQIANDSFSVADRAYTHAASEDLGVEWFKYAGGRVSDSREFCLDRDAKFYHKHEVEKWAHLEWTGKIKGTNESTIFITCGGYNCKHSLVPVSAIVVPKDVLIRNIESGNFKPTDFEKSALGLVA